MTALTTKNEKKIWTHDDTFATVLLTALLDRFGTEVTEWSPPTLLLEVHDEFGVEITPRNFNKLMAGIALMTSDAFYRSLPEFIDLCNALGGSSPVATSFDPADAYECCWGINEALLISPPDEDDEEPFDEQIIRYIGVRLDYEGVLKPPGVLQLGLRDNDPEAFVSYSFSDDPLLFSSIWESGREKSSYIDETVKNNIRKLLQQLAELPLENKSRAEQVQRKATDVLAVPSQK